MWGPQGGVLSCFRVRTHAKSTLVRAIHLAGDPRPSFFVLVITPIRQLANPHLACPGLSQDQCGVGK